MNNLASLFVPAVFGLLAGIGHGITSHHLDLPLSLTEQLLPTTDFVQSSYIDE